MYYHKLLIHTTIDSSVYTSFIINLYYRINKITFMMIIITTIIQKSYTHLSFNVEVMCIA